jgi:hypothetical protein
MATLTKYTKGHIRAAIAKRRSSFNDFMQRILSEQSNDIRFFFYIENLLVVIYEHHLNGKFITKSQACRFIPIGHSNTCKRYLEEAEARGYVKFVPDDRDSRRINVVPTEELIAYVTSKIENAIDEARELIGEVASVHPLPKDNRPLAEYHEGRR